LFLFREVGHDDVYASGCLKAVYETWISCAVTIRPSLPPSSYAELERQVQATRILFANDKDLVEVSIACRPALLLVLSATAEKLETIRTYAPTIFDSLDSHYRPRLSADWTIERRRTVHDIYCVQVAQLILSMRIASGSPIGRLTDALGARFRLILYRYYQRNNRTTDQLTLPL